MAEKPLSLRQSLVQRKEALWTDRSSFDSHWMDLAEYFLPRSGRFFNAKRNSGDQSKYNSILDNSGTRALRVLAAGMMSGMTSPARPWFRLSIGDKAMMEYGPVKEWLQDVTDLMRGIFHKSNTYRALHMMYVELGLFGTATSIIAEDYKDVIRHYPLTAGEYALAQDGRGEVNACYRQFKWTVAQVVGTFGLGNVSNSVKALWEKGALEKEVDLLHIVEPRGDREVGQVGARNMRWRSIYLEDKQADDKVLRESGFNEYPALSPRWEVFGTDTYGQSPGMEALGDTKQLQQEQLRKGQAIDYKTNPPLQVPVSMKGRTEQDRLPGGIMYYDGSAQAGIRSAYDVNLDLNHLLADLQDVRQRIDRAFYVDLFLMLANDTRSGVTAREIAERHEEKLLMLGPVLERLNDEMLAPKIERTFAIMTRTGILPPPPQELQGSNLDIEFIGTLAQAQRMVGIGSIDRLLMTVGSIAPVKPDVMDKLDADQIVDTYADYLGVDPRLIVADEKVAMIRKERAQQQAAMQQAAMAQQSADTAKTLSDAKTGEQNALSDAINAVSGYRGVG